MSGKTYAVIVLFVLVGAIVAFTPSLRTANEAERLMLKFGRQIPSAPMGPTIAWHLRRGD